MSLVESCPSTEMRSNERFTHTPSSRSAVPGVSAASVWTKHSIVAKAGEIIPAPLLWADRRTVPDGSSTSSDALLANRSVVRIDSPKAASPSGASSRRASAMPRITLSVSSGTPITPVEATATCSSCTPGGHRARALHARGVLEPAAAGGRVGVAGVGDHGAQAAEAAALLGEQDGRREHARAGEARRAHGVRRVGDEQAEVEPAGRLEPARDARRAEAGGQAAGQLGDVLGQLDPARLHVSPSLSSRPEHQVEVLDRLRGGALPEVVDRGEDDDAAGPVVAVDGDAAVVGLPHLLHPRRALDDLDPRLAVVGRRRTANAHVRLSRRGVT